MFCSKFFILILIIFIGFYGFELYNIIFNIENRLFFLEHEFLEFKNDNNDNIIRDEIIFDSNTTSIQKQEQKIKSYNENNNNCGSITSKPMLSGFEITKSICCDHDYHAFCGIKKRKKNKDDTVDFNKIYCKCILNKK